MHDNPVHSFFQFLTGQLGDQMSAGGMRWVTVVLYWLLLVAGIGIAVFNLRRDPEQRTVSHVSIAVMRFLGAGMFYVGSLWKLPLPVSAGFQFWMENTIKFTAWKWHGDLMQLFLDHITIAAPLVYLMEVGIAASLMLGFMVRLSATVGALFILNLMIGLFNDPSEWVWTYVGLICAYGMFAAAQAGRSLGLDNVIAKRMLPVFSENESLVRAIRWAS
ncbi:hypothetical protein [Rhodopila sp.]|uniref:hypothetical protein n=1 Tax=Rhodopila sp. TaxID=2480087 RepID=UPI003D12E38E